MKGFVPHPALRSGHLMTIATAFVRRRHPRLPAATPRVFEVESAFAEATADRPFSAKATAGKQGTQVRGDCHWQERPREHPTLVLLHGLEGSSESAYMLGTAEKAWGAGFNVVRLNQRNCGGTEKLTSTLYHSGRSGDIRAVITELIERDQLPEVFAAGFSMGGNLVLKMAGEWSDSAPPQMRAFAAVAPCLDLAACADALGAPRNFIYNRHFVVRLKQRMRYKAGLFPNVYASIDGMRGIRTVRDFDEVITARFCGFQGADDYYARSSAMHVLDSIRRPTLILTAQDDPFVPFSTFDLPALRENSHVTFMGTRHGGHCGYISREAGDERFWAEARIAEFVAQQSRIKS